MFRDRLDALGKKTHVGWTAIARNHRILDAIDRKVGIRTRHGCASAYLAGAKPFPQSEYVGARLARLEAHVSRSKAQAMFWLGAEG